MESFRAPATADGVPRLLGTHTRGTVVVARCTFGFLPLGEQVSYTCCVCAQRSAAWYSSPLYGRICVLGLRSSLSTGLAHNRPPLHRDQVHPPPTSAIGLSRSLAHLCTAKESVPRRPLHRNRIRPSPTSAPPLLPSGTSASAQHKCDAAAQHSVATTCTVLQPSATCERSR